MLLKDAGCSSNAPVVTILRRQRSRSEVRSVAARLAARSRELAYAWQHVGKGSTFVSRLRRFGRFAMLGPRGSGERISRCGANGRRIRAHDRLPARVPDAIRAMDEHWDGGGYPYGLRRDQAPLFARIIGLAQVWKSSAATAGRARLAVARARSGRWFDPDLVDALDDPERDSSSGPVGHGPARSGRARARPRGAARLPPTMGGSTGSRTRSRSSSTPSPVHLRSLAPRRDLCARDQRAARRARRRRGPSAPRGAPSRPR